MSNAIKEMRDYLAKSPSVVYPEDVLAYLPAIEAENAKLREELEAAKHDLSLFSGELVASKFENDKLRELAHLVTDYVSADQCEGCVAKRACNAGELDMCWIRKAILEKLCELGVEVDW